VRAARPRNSAMSSERGLLLPSFDDALARYLRERELMEKRTDDVESAHYAS
jgi:dTDP-4-dehydrorhamnose reductase